MIDDKDPSTRRAIAELQRLMLQKIASEIGTMNRNPKKGEPYQVCTHLAIDAERTDLHYWQVPGRDPWIVLCGACHVSFSERRSVEIHGKTLALAADIPIVPGSSCVHHSAPGEAIANDPPPAGQKPPNSPIEVLKFRPKEKAEPWLPIAEQLVSTVARLVGSFEANWQARAKIELRHKELEVQAMQCMIRTLETNAATIERLQETAIESQAAMAEKIQRLEKKLLLHTVRVNPTASDSKTPSSGAIRRRV